MTTPIDKRKIEQAEYRAKIAESELHIIKGSRAYRSLKFAGSIKARISKDPIGFFKKAAKLLLKTPTKIINKPTQNFIAEENMAEQNKKYQEWIILNEPDAPELEIQKEESEQLSYKPLISIITPVFNPPTKVLEELIESVLTQTYANFELCLGNFGDNPEVKMLIDKYSKTDPRVKNFIYGKNEGIASNSNQILSKVKGEFIALLDHDDTLSPDALFENVKLLNKGNYDFIYSDKDKIDRRGNRFDPLFKPEFSPEMLLNINYLTHLNIIRTDLVLKVGGWNVNTDGAQDWDLFFKVITKTSKIAHIPKILYHWRVIPSSTAMSIDTKPYALSGQRRAVDLFLSNKKIPAAAYHKRTELFLKWNKNSIDSHPLIFVKYSNPTNALRIIGQIRRGILSPEIVLISNNNKGIKTVKNLTGVDVVESEAKALSRYLKDNKTIVKDRTVVFMLDSIRLPKQTEWYEHLTGWLSIPEVAASSGRLVDKHDLIVSSGSIITPDRNTFPIFKNYPRYAEAYIGNAEWVRNLSILSPYFWATKQSHLKEFDFNSSSNKNDFIFDDYFIWLSIKRNKRLVMTPHVTATIYQETDLGIEHKVKDVKEGFQDPYGNKNLNKNNPMQLFVGIPETTDGKTAETDQVVDLYQRDAVILSRTYNITAHELAKNSEVTSSNDILLKPPSTVGWFLPSFDAIYAGLMNIFSFANYLAGQHKIETTFYIMKAVDDLTTEKKLIAQTFPILSKANFVPVSSLDTSNVKAHDIGIATQWSTAFPLARADDIKKKFYFIQDNESNFYPKGTTSALVELTYRFGFRAIAGTEGLLDMYKNNYAGRGVVLKSKIDLSSYCPRRDIYHVPQKPYRVFFYARPSMPRNAFELGIAGLRKLKEELKENVEVITAGAEWYPEQFEVEGMFTNLGKIPYEKVPKLYRSIDAGLMFMFSGHPGVTASELMASGCPVVVNRYKDKTWEELYKDEITCLITEPTASEISRNIQKCLKNQELRKKIIDGGLEKVREFYTGYEANRENAYKYLFDS